MLWSGCSSHAANESKWVVAVTFEQEWTETRIFQTHMHICTQTQTLKNVMFFAGLYTKLYADRLLLDFDKANAGKNISVMQY